MTTARNLASRPRAAGEYRIGRYRVRARLGKGGMGVVYLGRDEALDRDVAIKTLRLDGSPDDESRGRFEIEARAAARLQHPNIVTVFELGEDRGLPYIAMELLGGQDLEMLLRSGESLSAAERIDVVIQTLRGLDFAHHHQIVHRDIKPSNLRVLDDGSVKILDFGIAKVESTGVTRAGMMVGTPYYMSPEHIRGGTLDGRSDVFAVGVILHELFALKRPFTAEDPTRVLYRIVNEPHPRLRLDAAGTLTVEVQRVIDMSLEKAADDRYGSAALMADDLARVRERCPSPQLSAEDTAALSHARRSLAMNKAGATLLPTVEAIARANPEATEAQRMLRFLKRKPADTQAMAETLAFPELDATFEKAAAQGDETVASGRTIEGRAETLQQGGRPEAPVAPPPAPNRVLYGVLGTSLVLASLAAMLLYNRDGGAPVVPTPPTETPRVAQDLRPDLEPVPERPVAPVAPAATSPTMPVSRRSIEITSQPQGATVRIDRKTVGVTPLRTEVTANAGHTITLTLPGYRSKEIKVVSPIPGSVGATLVPDGPPASLVVESAYPVTVSVSGRVIATDRTGATATLPSGNHDVVLESASLFLRHRESIHLDPGSSFTVRAPPLGKIGVRASPDNCKVFVNGVFVDYPPILDRGIAAGRHVVRFEWPDGTSAEEKVQIQGGKPSYVMGRKP